MLLKQNPKEDEKIDQFYIKNLQTYVKELSDENYKLKEKNSELESLLAAASDDLEYHEEALIEIGRLYEELEKKYNLLVQQNRDKDGIRDDTITMKL